MRTFFSWSKSAAIEELDLHAAPAACPLGHQLRGGNQELDSSLRWNDERAGLCWDDERAGLCWDDGRAGLCWDDGRVACAGVTSVRACAGMTGKRNSLFLDAPQPIFTVIPEAAKRQSGLRSQDCKRERRKRPGRRAPGMARVIRFFVRLDESRKWNFQSRRDGCHFSARDWICASLSGVRCALQSSAFFRASGSDFAASVIQKQASSPSRSTPRPSS